jgi:hypothetical protein
MRRLLAPLALLFLCGADDCRRPDVTPTSVRVVEYNEITGSLPGPALHVWMVADDKRDLCFAVFRSDSVAVVKVDCATVKPKPEKGCP